MLWLKERRKAEPGPPLAGAASRPAPPPRRARRRRQGVQLNLPARVREGTRRWSIEVASITTRVGHLRQLRRAGHRLAAVDRAARARRLAGADRLGRRLSLHLRVHPAAPPRRARADPRARQGSRRTDGIRAGLVGLAGAIGVEQGRDQGGRADADRRAGDQLLGPRTTPAPSARRSPAAASPTGRPWDRRFAAMSALAYELGPLAVCNGKKREASRRAHRARLRTMDRSRIRPVRHRHRRLRHRLERRRGSSACSCPRRATRPRWRGSRRRFPGLGRAAPPPAIAAAAARIAAFLAGGGDDFADLALDMAGIGAFDRAVYREARAIPAGATATYGAIAARLGDPAQARAVGQALGRNPWPIVIPCHRVTGADGRMGGFSAPGGRATKLRLLEIEGALAPESLPLFAPAP